jgi:hypothetical protein
MTGEIQPEHRRGLGLGLCDSANVLSPEKLRGLDHDLQELHIMARGIRSIRPGELIN